MECMFPAYMLVDAGYDVWLGNNRGNVYSKSHISLLPTDRHFWNFRYTRQNFNSFFFFFSFFILFYSLMYSVSFFFLFLFYFSYHELGMYDVPATIDYIINQTNCEQIFYIGHSQGTT